MEAMYNRNTNTWLKKRSHFTFQTRPPADVVKLETNFLFSEFERCEHHGQ